LKVGDLIPLELPRAPPAVFESAAQPANEYLKVSFDDGLVEKE
jgi:hypothetical protein